MTNNFIKQIEEAQETQQRRLREAHEKFPDIQRESWEDRQRNRLEARRSKEFESYDLSDSKAAPFRLTFIIGTNRTGSTLLNGLLAGGDQSYPGLPDMHPLSDLITTFHNLLFRYDDNHFNHYGSHQRLIDIFKKPIHDTIMSSFFNAGFKIGEKKHMVLKSANDFSLYIDRVPDIFGDNFKIVYIIRDPRDVIASNKVYRGKTGKGDLITELVPNIKNYYDSIHATKMFHNKDHFFLVQYEDLVNQNEEVFSALEEFLGFDVSRTGFREMGYTFNDKLPQHAKGWGGELHKESVSKYKETLTPEEIECVEYFFDKYLDLYGYK